MKEVFMLVLHSCLRLNFNHEQKRYELRNMLRNHRLLMVDCELDELQRADECLPPGWMSALLTGLIQAHATPAFEYAFRDDLPATLEYDAEKGLFSLSLDVVLNEDGQAYLFSAPTSDQCDVVFTFHATNELDLPLVEFEE